MYSIVNEQGRHWTWNLKILRRLADVLVELNGIEPMTSGLQSPRSPS